ncbi:DNA-binding domain-containing protein, AraC-type [Actinoalloteichus hymeniacidonis]|uniref:DNA-binding domain-containing protein, AraC-type n=2 Tax=Actinoalloteichus hymeniacidonis TaxID=340345 RepID=A0AAC9HME3_9PSEU|nr:DNA-binding domain-containing protein, AraC-type [Actinoalloteichus hymeniacidonis]
MERWATPDVRAGERGDFFADLVHRYHCEMDIRFSQHEDFVAHGFRQTSGLYQILDWRQRDECRLLRGKRQISRDPYENYLFVLPFRASLGVTANDAEAELFPQTGVLLTVNEPIDVLGAAGLHAAVLAIPSREIDARLDRCDLFGAIDLSTGVGRIVRDIVTGLMAEAEVLNADQFNAICDRMVEMLCMAVVGDDRPGVASHADTVATSIRRHVRNHARDPHLTGESIAHALGWSLRYVQLVLRRSGTTPRELIREERLRLARELLMSPAHRHLSISNIAHAAGFASHSAFSTTFRQRFGNTPRDLRPPHSGAAPTGEP